MKNAFQYVPKQVDSAGVSEDIKSVFDAVDSDAAQAQLNRVVRKYQQSAPKLATWLEENIPEGFAVFRLPGSHRRRLRTSNALERLNRELKRRTRVAASFPTRRRC